MPYWIQYYFGESRGQSEARNTLVEAQTRARFIQDQWAVNGACCHYRIYYGEHLADSSYEEKLATLR